MARWQEDKRYFWRYDCRMIKQLHSALAPSFVLLLLVLLWTARAQIQVKGVYKGTTMKFGYKIYQLPDYNNTRLQEETESDGKLTPSNLATLNKNSAGSKRKHPIVVEAQQAEIPVSLEDTAEALHGAERHGKERLKTALRASLNATLSSSKERSSERSKSRNTSDGSFAFGKEIKVDFDIRLDGTWFDVPEGGRVWRLGLRSTSAVCLSLLFDSFQLPPGGELYVRGETASLGAFVAEYSNKPSMKFSTVPLPGRILDIEYYSPPGLTEVPLLHISSVIHGYRLPAYEKSASGFCHVDALFCEREATQADQRRAVVVLMTENGKKFCSGCMVNNAAYDGRQYFLTARHCVSGSDSDPSYNILGFNFEAVSCSRAKAGLLIRESASGLRPLANSIESDFALFEVEERIPDSYHVYMAGWSLVKTSTIFSYGIHHPRGDIKKICIHEGSLSLTNWHPYRHASQKNHWVVDGWKVGCTEHGSSGSPLFDQNGLMIGQLHGGYSSCRNQDESDYYGALWASYELGMAPYLNPYNWTKLQSVQGAYLEDIRKAAKCSFGENHAALSLSSKRSKAVNQNSIVTAVTSAGSQLLCAMFKEKPQASDDQEYPSSVFDIVARYEQLEGSSVSDREQIAFDCI